MAGRRGRGNCSWDVMNEMMMMMMMKATRKLSKKMKVKRKSPPVTSRWCVENFRKAVWRKERGT